MIKKLSVRDKTDIEYYLQKKPMFSQFMRIFIRDTGIENADFFGCYDKSECQCLFVVFSNNLMVYSHLDTIPVEEIVEYLKAHSINISIIKGEETLLTQFKSYVQVVTKYGTLLCKLFKENFTPVDYSDVDIKRANSTDIEDVLGFFNNTVEYKRLLSIEDTKKFIDCGYTYYVKEEGKIVALTMSNYFNSDNANISVLVTAPSARNKGYGSKLLSRICADLLKVSNSCSICYDVINSLSIYRTVGFKEIGKQAIYITLGLK